MDGQFKKNRQLKLVVFTVILYALLFSAGCGPSYKEQLAMKKAEQKQKIQKDKEKDKHAMGQMAKRHNAILFPSKNFGNATFSYEFQEYLKKHPKTTVVFKGYLQDIEQAKGGIIVEFISPLGKKLSIKKKDIRFRLTISESSLGQLLKSQSEAASLNKPRHGLGAGYYVVARVEDITRSRIYEFYGDTIGKEVEIESDVSNGFIASGEFIECAPILSD